MSNKVFNITTGFTVKTVDPETNSITIEGYANTTTKDRVGDIILEEAWTKGGLNNYLKNPIVLAYHDHSKPIGLVTETSVTAKGLKVVAEISKAAGSIYELVSAGILKAFSVGFKVKDADYDKKTDLFVIKDLELYELSVVAVPANADSTFSIKKAFSNTSELLEFKSEFEEKSVLEDGSKETTTITDNLKEDEEIYKMSLEAKLLEAQKALEKEVKDREAREEADAKVKALEEAKAAAIEAATSVVTVQKEGVEKLLEDMAKRFEDNEGTIAEAIAGIREELKEKSDEITAFRRNKFNFEEKNGNDTTSIEEKDTATMLALIMGKSVKDTKYGADIIAKSGEEHLTGLTASGDPSLWESEFSTRLINDIRQKLVIEPMFTTIKMSTVSMFLPINPDASVAYWIPTTDFNEANMTDLPSSGKSSGTAAVHSPTDINLIAYKLAAKNFLGFEEEEDSIIALVPMIRDAVVRRMARATDIALLRGTGVTSATQSANFPIKGIAQKAIDAGGAQLVSKSIANDGAITATDLQTCRRGLGIYGLNPMEVVYIVSQEAYYDLLEDPDFRTVDVASDKATILTGQIGSINGSPVVISGEFEAKAATKVAVVALNKSNFLVGTLKGMTTERVRQPIEQRNVLIATRRLGFTDLIAGKGSSVIRWAA